MDHDEMKAAWRDTGRSLREGNRYDKTAETWENGTPNTALDNLRERYRRFMILGFVMCMVTPTMLTRRIFPGEGMRWISLAFIVYFLTCAFMDLYLYRGIKQIDCVRMPVAEVIRLAAFYRKRHLLFVAILIPLACMLLAAMFLVAGGDAYFAIGMGAGALVGILLGTQALRRFLKDYRDIA